MSTIGKLGNGVAVQVNKLLDISSSMIAVKASQIPIRILRANDNSWINLEKSRCP